MKSFKLGDKVRAKSNHAICGAYKYRFSGLGEHSILIDDKFKAYIPDDEIELVPPEPFDMQGLRVGDAFGWKDNYNRHSLRVIITASDYATCLPAHVVYRPQDNGDLRLIYDRDRGGYIGDER